MKIICFILLFIPSVGLTCFISNPYTPGTGHYAGFEWAQSKDVSSCGGNSQSFINGCEEYLKQKRACEGGRW